MVSKLFLQTVGGALLVGAIAAFYDFEWFVPGALLGAMAALLTFGIRDPKVNVLEMLSKETDVNIFRAFIVDLLSRIEEVCHRSLGPSPTLVPPHCMHASHPHGIRSASIPFCHLTSSLLCFSFDALLPVRQRCGGRSFALGRQRPS